MDDPTTAAPAAEPPVPAAPTTPAAAPRRAAQKKLTKAEKEEVWRVLTSPEVDGDFTLCSELTGAHYTTIDRIAKDKVTETMRSAEVAGNTALTAQILKLPYHRVLKIVGNDPWLKAHQTEAPVDGMIPTETDLIGRKDVGRMGSALTGEAKIEYDAMAKQNKLLTAQDWEALGLTAEQGENLIMAEKRAALPLGRLLNVTQGQLVGSMAQVEDMLKRIGDRLVNGAESKHGPFPVEYDSNENVKNTERQWLLAYYGGVDRLLQMHNAMLKTRTSMLDAQKKMKELLEKRGDGKGQLGGKPLKRVEPAGDLTPIVDAESQ